MTILILRSHKRNVFLLWCRFPNSNKTLSDGVGGNKAVDFSGDLRFRYTGAHQMLVSEATTAGSVTAFPVTESPVGFWCFCLSGIGYAVYTVYSTYTYSCYITCTNIGKVLPESNMCDGFRVLICHVLDCTGEDR
jgi:hypothetical protein